MTEDEAADRLRTFLVAVDAEATALKPSRLKLTDITFAHQTAPRPLGGYATIYPLGFRDAAEADWSAYDEVQLDGDMRVVETKTRVLEFGFRVHVYAKGAGGLVKLFVNAFRSAKQVELLPLVVREVTRVGQDPELVTQHWEDRANFTVTLAANACDDVVIDVVESGTINMEAKFDGGTRQSSNSYTKP